MWEYSVPRDQMRFSDAELSPGDLEAVMKVLVGKDHSPALSPEAAALYDLPAKDRAAILAKMSTFSEADPHRQVQAAEVILELSKPYLADQVPLCGLPSCTRIKA